MAHRDALLSKAYDSISKSYRWENIYKQYFKPINKNGDWLNGHCPLPEHGGKDKTPSFGVNIKEGTYNCFVCGGGDGVDFLMKAGNLSMDAVKELLIKESGIDVNQSSKISDREFKQGYFDNKKTKSGTLKYICSYIYQKNNVQLYRKNRYEGYDNTGDRIKVFDFWINKNGSWYPCGKNNKLDSNSKVLYKNDNISISINQNKPLFLCEGEKDVDLLKLFGYCAVTAGGVNEWQSRFAKEFVGAEVYIIPDNDVPGIRAAERIARDLVNVGVVPLIVDWNRVTLVTGGFPGEFKQKHGEDVSDLLEFFGKKHKKSRDETIHPTMSILLNESKKFNSNDGFLESMDLLYDFELNDTGNALRLIKLHGKDIRFCPEWNYWLYYKGYWAQDIEGHIQEKVRNTINELKQKAMELGDKDTISFAIRSGNFSRQKSMLEVAKNYVEYGVPVTAKYWDSNHGLICLKNGTIDTKLNNNQETFEIREHRRDDYITKQLDFDYDGEAKCPLWEKFLSEILPDLEVRSFVQRAIGYSMTGDTSEDAIFILWGGGQNGKSTLVDVLCEMLGDYAKTITPDTLMHKERNNTPNTEIARVRGTRLVRTSEADEGKRLSESMIKILTSGEPVSARFLYGHDFEYKPTYKIWFSTNHKPVIRGSDNGIWRRIFLIPFEVTIKPEQKDGSLDIKLSKEIPGIFNWALAGLMQWKQRGLDPPKKVQDAIDEYRKEQDMLQGFIDECIEANEKHNVVASKMFERYIKYCEANNQYKLTSTAFGRKMCEKGYQKAKVGSYVYYQNIRLKEQEEFVPVDDSHPF